MASPPDRGLAARPARSRGGAPASDAAAGARPGEGRLRSLDALRGFDMLWITGGAAVLAAAAEATGWAPLVLLERQTHHAAWHGFTLWDLVFPLFLFLAGVALPFSLASRRARGASERDLHVHALRRGIALVLLGLVYNGLLALDLGELRLPSVLGRIGLGWLGAALVALHAGTRGRVAWVAAVLLGYWALLALVPAPGLERASLAPGETVVDWVDRAVLPGRLHRGVRDPEGLLSTVPAVATALLGVLAGTWLRRTDRTPAARSAGLALAGVAGVALGGVWHLALPLNKNLWTSSFVVWTAGWSALLLAAFHYALDVRGRGGRWAFPLVVIGANAITIYLLERFVDFEGLVLVAVGDAERLLHPVVVALFALGLRWLVLYALWRRRWFLRV